MSDYSGYSGYSAALKNPHELTPYEKELLPYVRGAESERESKANLLRPIELIFDILNTGQYVTANIGETAGQVLDKPLEEALQEIAKAAWLGLTWQRKGDWEKTLFGSRDEEGTYKPGWFEWEPEQNKFARGALGFIANVLLDPTTYIGFGPTRAAKRAASQYADDVIKITTKTIGNQLPDLMKKGFDPAKAAEKMAKSGDDFAKYFSSFGTDYARHADKIKKEAYKEGLREPAAYLSDKLYKELTADQERILSMSGETTEFTKDMLSRLEDVEKWTEKVLPGRYAGAGTRGQRFMRKQITSKESYPGWLKQWDHARQMFQESKMGGLYSDALWAINSRGPVGWLRRALRIRNPYQQSLANVAADIKSGTSQSYVMKGERILAIFADLDDNEVLAVKNAMVGSQIEQAKGGAKRAVDILREMPEKIDKEKLYKAVININDFTDEMLQYNQKAVKDGLAPNMGSWQDYLPVQHKKPGVAGPGAGGFMRKRTVGWEQNIENQVEKIKWLSGMDDDMARQALETGVTDLNVDIRDMLLRRSFAQTRFEQRCEMVRGFREFGINVGDIENSALYESILGRVGNLEQLGLRPIHAKGLEGYLFDDETAEILERATAIMSDDKTLKALSTKIDQYTSLWRSWATMSPGFHLRNFYSNNVTGFLNHGFEWFDVKTHGEAFICAYYGLNGEKGLKQLGKVFPENFIADVLQKEVSPGVTNKMMAGWATSKGVITKQFKGVTTSPSTFDEFVKGSKLNPFSQKFGPIKASKALGSMVESQARYTSFLLDYRKAIGEGATSDAAREYAKLNAKKLFIDYEDLSQVERKVLKNILPFYSWIRGNIANQITQLFSMPEMYSLIPKAQGALGEDYDRTEVPGWMRELGMFPVGEEEERQTLFWPNLPYMDLNKIPILFNVEPGKIPTPVIRSPFETLGDVMGDVHPLLKSWLEVTGEKDLFLQVPLGERRKAPRLLNVFRAVPGAVEFLDGLMRGIYGDGLGLEVDHNNNLVMDSKIAKVLENNLLLLQRIPQYFDIFMLLPAVQQWRDDVTGAEPTYKGLEKFFQVLSFYGGIKFKQVPEDYWEQEAEGIMKEAEKGLTKQRQKMPGYRVQRQEYIDTRLRRIKKLGILR